MDSPCVNICTLDATSGLCAGCLRSMDEIAAWSGLTSVERKRIMATLAQRRQPPDKQLGVG